MGETHANGSEPNQQNTNEIFKRVLITDKAQNQRFNLKSPSHGRKRLGAGADTSRSAAKRRPDTKMRFVICTLGLMSLAMSQMSRMVLNLSITSMIHPDMLKSSSTSTKDENLSSDGSCPRPSELPATTMDTCYQNNFDISTSIPCEDTPITSLPEPKIVPSVRLGEATTATILITPEPSTSFNLDDNTEPDSLADVATTKEPSFTTSNVTLDTNDELPEDINRFKWTIKQQNVLLGGFYYSYFVFMILGGRMAEIYGAKYVLLLGVAGSALINLATPWMARSSFAMLVGSRVVLGAIQSGVFPAMYALINKWLTMSEASIFAPLIKMNLRLGMMLGTMVPGFMPDWPEVFYFAGVLSAIWSVVWLVVASSDPEDCKWVSESELNHIARKKKKTPTITITSHGSNSNNTIELKPVDKQSAIATTTSTATTTMAESSDTANDNQTPWLRLITAPSVIGLIVVKLTLNHVIDFLSIELPSYLRYVHHADKSVISAITTGMFSIQVCLIIFIGWLAKDMVKRRPFGASKTAVRKAFQGLANFGSSLLLLLITFNDCNLTYVIVLLQILSFLTMFTAGGETMLPYDLSQQYPATIMAIANSIANVSAITTTILAGQILGDQGGSQDRWNMLFYLVSGTAFVGGVVFLVLVKADPIDFSRRKSQDPESSNVVVTDQRRLSSAASTIPEGANSNGVTLTQAISLKVD